MKTPATPGLVISAILCGALAANAQLLEMPATLTGSNKAKGLESAEHPSFAADKLLSGVYMLPEVRKTKADLSESMPVFVEQDALTLSTTRSSARRIENVLDLSILRETSAYGQAEGFRHTSLRHPIGSRRTGRSLP